MNEQRPYGILPSGASRFKRKDRESLLPPKRPPPPPPPPRAAVAASTTTGSKGIEIASPNKLLAGYLAYEFLTKGTLLGQKLDAARSETGIRPVTEPRTPVNNGGERYREITSLLMMKTDEGGRIPGIVNPAQLWRWIEM
ncbi:hypothetical protein SSX86_012867 [Deinandra increscens subsp. villosa]|uniref:Uncharacterized protein n=1 Tax=Deinandra increscens subsp. villosa TaxID=3103831 RepID=A0AAP0D9I5_9ASTR